MHTQYKHNILNYIAILSMFFCIVFASPLKVLIDTIDFENIETKELVEEESSEKEECKTEKEVVSKYTSQHYSSEIKFNNISLQTAYYSIIKIKTPYFKIHTPPPDILLS